MSGGTIIDALWAALGDMSVGLAPFFNLFRDERVAILLAGLLLLAAIAAGFWFWLAWRPWFRDVRRAAIYVERLPRDAGEFFEHFEGVRSMLGGTRRLAHAWTEFAETLIVPETPAPIRNTTRPHFYFNVHAATEAGLPLPFFLSLPNVFVGIGLLFTFVGLVSALYFAAQGVTSPNVAEAQHALEGLLKAATFKFLTSIAGVLASIVLSLGFRRLQRRLQVVFERLSSALEARLSFVTAEGIALDQRLELQRQTLQLERFNTDFAVELANALDQRLSATLAASLTQAVQPVVSAVESLSGNLGAHNQDALGRMIDDFRSGLKESSGAELQNVVTALGNVRDTLEAASAGMGQNGADFAVRIEQAATSLESRLGEAARSMAEGLASATSRMETLVQQSAEQARGNAEETTTRIGTALRAASEAAGQHLQGASAQLAGDVTRLIGDFAAAVQPVGPSFAGLQETLHTLDGRFRTHITRFDETTQRLLDLVAQIERTGERLQGVAAPIAETAKRFETAGSRVQDAARGFDDVQKRLATVSASLDQSVAKNNTVWDEYRRRFEHADEQLAKVVKALAQGANDYQVGVSRFVVEIDKHLSQAMLQFRGTLEELKEVLEEIDNFRAPPAANVAPGARPTHPTTPRSR